MSTQPELPIQPHKLPSLEDLQNDKALANKTDELNYLLNLPPPAKWVKTNTFANNSKYIPIDKVEFLLTKIFQQWRVEVLDYKPIFNSVTCHIRLHYKNPLTGEWQYHDGVGAAQVQTAKGSSPADMASINNNAVQMALPMSKSYAIKDAADHLGSLFGRDLNRKDLEAFSPTYNQELKVAINEELKKKYENGAGTNNK